MTQSIGDYELLEPLGGGAMGVVYRARHPRSRREVALKTVHLDDPHQLSNLRAEIVALARLAHPGVVGVLDHGTHEGRPYLVTQLIEGHGLGDRPTQFSPPATDGGPKRLEGEELRTLLSLFSRLARALAYVHGEGVVHRDLKPGNVVVRPDGLPVLIDFGLARLRSTGPRESLDAQRGAVGTALYMSPEQIQGQLVDARADLYALGAMMHRAFSGEVPFLGETVSGVLAMHLTDPPSPLSRLVDGTPAALDALVLGLLEKDRRNRVPYALDVVEILVGLGADDSTDPSAPTPRPYVYSSALLGREDELRRAEDALAGLMDGKGAVLVIDGESGVGKTRFIAEVIEAVSYEPLLAVGECDAPVGPQATTAVGDRPLDGLRPLLRRVAEHVRQHPESAPQILAAEGHLLSLYEPDLLPFADLRDAPPLPTPGRTQERLVAAVLGVASRLATRRPLVVVLDDIQWADAITAAWAREVAAGALAEARVAVVLAMRIEGGVTLPDGPTTQVFHLEPLDPSAMSEIASQMLGARESQRGALGALVQAAQGNPFALASAVRTAAEEGVLVRQGRGRWRLSGASSLIERLTRAGAHVAVAMARARLGGLGADGRALAAGLAVLGGAARLEDIADVALGGDLVRAAGGFGDAMRRGVIVHGTAGALALAHDKLREEAYADLTPDRRAELHRATADHLARGASQTAEVHALMAQHRLLGGDTAQAVADGLTASEGFEARGASNEALRAAEGAVSAAASLGETIEIRRRALVRLGGLLVSLGAVPRARTLLSQALGEAEAASDASVVAAAHVHLSYAAYLQGDLEGMFDRARRGAEVAANLGDRRVASRAENALGIAWGSSGQFRKAISHYRRAAALAEELADEGQVGRFLSNISINHRLLGELEEAEACARDAIARTRLLPPTHANAWCNLGRILLEADRADEAEQAFERALSIATRTHNVIVGAEATWGLALTALAAGDATAASLRIDSSLAIAREGELATAEAQSLRALGWVLAMAADEADALARARTALDRSVEMLRTMPERDELADGLRARAFVRSRGGDERGAAADLAEARGIFEELEMAGRVRDLDQPMSGWRCY